MAKVKLSDLMRNADPRARGRFNIAATPHGAVAKAWPRKRGKAKSGYDFYRQQEFGLAAQYASSPLDLDLFTATEMAKGTEQVPRDILQMALYGYYYTLVFPDGRTSIPAREMTNNVQYILDLLDPVVGAVIVRQEIGWIAIPPGPIGHVLTITDGTPHWAPPSGGGGGAGVGANVIDVFSKANPYAANYATFGNVITPWTGLNAFGVQVRMTTVSGAAYALGIAPFDPSTGKLTNTPQLCSSIDISNSGAFQFLTGRFPSHVALTAGQAYMLMQIRTDNGPTGSQTMDYVSDERTDWGLFIPASGTAFYADDTAPSPSSTWTSAGGGIWSIAALLGADA